MRWIIWEHTYVKYLVERIKTILLDQCINNEHLIAFLNRITICNTLMRIFVLKITENIQKTATIAPGGEEFSAFKIHRVRTSTMLVKEVRKIAFSCLLASEEEVSCRIVSFWMCSIKRTRVCHLKDIIFHTYQRW